MRPRLKMAEETCGFLGWLSWAWDAIADVAGRPIGLRPIDGATGATAGAAAAAEALAGATAGAIAGAKKAANDEAKHAPTARFEATEGLRQAADGPAAGAVAPGGAAGLALRRSSPWHLDCISAGVTTSTAAGAVVGATAAGAAVGATVGVAAL